MNQFGDSIFPPPSPRKLGRRCVFPLSSYFVLLFRSLSHCYDSSCLGNDQLDQGRISVIVSSYGKNGRLFSTHKGPCACLTLRPQLFFPIEAPPRARPLYNGLGAGTRAFTRALRACQVSKLCAGIHFMST